MKKTYHGGCHCGAVKYEADIDFAEGTSKCNCTICRKLRWWGVRIRPDAFRLLSPSSFESDTLTDYCMNNPGAHQLFCKKCGVHSFHRFCVPQLGGEFISINVGCLDDFEPPEAAEVKVIYADGRNNNWSNAPEETRHL